MTGRPLLLVLVFLLTVIAGLAANFPLATALQFFGPPLNYERAEGTIWSGRIVGAEVRGRTLGTIGIETNALPLLTGTVAGTFTSRGAVTGQGSFRLGMREQTVTQSVLTASLEGLNLRDAFGLPMQGVLEARIQELRLLNGSCRRAAGTVTTNTLDAALKALGSEPFALTGSVTCQAGNILIPLAGEGSAGSVKAFVTLRPTGGFTNLVRVTPNDPRLAPGLRLAGFEEQDGTYVLAQEGLLR